jgi:hypothetical protein
MTADAGRADRDAAHAIAAHLRGRLAPTLDADLVAADLVALIREQGWRHVPRPQPIAAQGRKDPETAKAGAERARKLMAERNRTKETDR